MNKYQKALNTIVDAIRDYVSYREFDLLPSEDDGEEYYFNFKPKYCPNCGSKIID